VIWKYKLNCHSILAPHPILEATGNGYSRCSTDNQQRLLHQLLVDYSRWVSNNEDTKEGLGGLRRVKLSAVFEFQQPCVVGSYPTTPYSRNHSNWQGRKDNRCKVKGRIVLVPADGAQFHNPCLNHTLGTLKRGGQSEHHATLSQQC